MDAYQGVNLPDTADPAELLNGWNGARDQLQQGALLALGRDDRRGPRSSPKTAPTRSPTAGACPRPQTRSTRTSRPTGTRWCAASSRRTTCEASTSGESGTPTVRTRCSRRRARLAQRSASERRVIKSCYTGRSWGRVRPSTRRTRDVTSPHVPSTSKPMSKVRLDAIR